MVCSFCEIKPTETYFGSYCTGCRQMKNLCNVYGYDRVLEILKTVCIRDSTQLESKILKQKEKIEVKTDKKK